MIYFKNVELARKYGISEATVRNWIKMSLSKKLDLMLTGSKGRLYVANNPANIKLIEALVKENRKYRNTNTAKTIRPLEEFYKTFDQKHIYDIVRNLEIHREIPLKYSYFDGGAYKWDGYAQSLSEAKIPNLLNSSFDLMQESQSFLDRILSDYDSVNIIDVGAGNALPSIGLIQYLLEKGKLRRYVALDISQSMIETAQRNVADRFGDKVKFEGHILDITCERFANIIEEEYLQSSSQKTINLVLLLGGTADNLRTPDDAFRTINESMNPHDLLLYTNKLERPEMRPQWFEHSAQPGKLELAPMHRLVFDLLNFDESLYDVEIGFDDAVQQRYTRARLRFALTIEFELKDGVRRVELEKGDAILQWRSWQMTASKVSEQFERNGFYTLYSSQSRNREYILTISEIKD